MLDVEAPGDDGLNDARPVFGKHDLGIVLTKQLVYV